MHARFLAACTLIVAGTPVAASADDIYGTWMRGDGAAHVRIGPCGDAICATNTWIRNPDQQGEKVGDRLIFKIHPDKQGWSGTAYDPQRQLSISARLKAAGGHLTTSGCVMGGMLCKSTRWTRM